MLVVAIQARRDSMHDAAGELIDVAGPDATGSIDSAPQRARAKIGLFLVLVAAFAAALDVARAVVPFGTKLAVLTWTPRMADTLGMWSVGIAGAIALAVIDRSAQDLGLKAAHRRYVLVALMLPFVYGAVVYVPVWLLQLGGFAGIALLGSAVPSALLHFPLHLFAAAGEEFGWRGVLVPNLARIAGSKVVAFLPGAIWALWHYPDILFFDYNVGTPYLFAMTCFSVSLVGAGAFLSWVRLASGSIWPAVIFHGVHNSVISGIFDRLTEPGPTTLYITSEFGVGMAVVGAAMGYLCWRKLHLG